MSVGEGDVPTKNPAPLLEVVELCTTFQTPAGPLRAVDEVSFTLERGRTLGIVGESGSGKTVLSRSIMGLLPARGVERSGQVLYNGRDLVSATERELSHIWGAEIAIVLQDPMTSLSPVKRIGAQLTDGIRHHRGVSRTQAKAMALTLLASVGLSDPARRFSEYPYQLSGGMRQRVVIAIALACGPSLLLADEPTTALDVTVQAQILDLLAAAQADRQMGMILVSHDLGVAAGRTDDIAVMYAGKIVERAPTLSLFTNPRMPYTEALMASIPRKDSRPHTPLRAIPGRPPDLTQLPMGCAFATRCSYVQERCRTERPPLRSDQPGHAFACWFPIGRSGPDKLPAASNEKSAADPTETPADDGHHRSRTPGDDGTTSELSSSGRGPS